jgi:tetratricopeptide (TPR) repeat protein
MARTRKESVEDMTFSCVSSRMGSSLPTVMLAICLGVGTGASLHIVDSQRPASFDVSELLYLPKGESAKLAAVGYREVAADLIWIRTLQLLADGMHSRRAYGWAYHAADVVTDLDPYSFSPYVVTGMILGVWGGMPEESIRILKKGIAWNPETWQLPFYVGYDYYFELHDPEQAAPYIRMAASLPGAPEYLGKFAARMTVEAGKYEAALEFLDRLQEQVQDLRLQEGLENRKREVILSRDIAGLEEAAQIYKNEVGHSPKSLDDLVRQGVIRGVPQEPFGGLYKISVKDGRVFSTTIQETLRVHRR